MGEKKNNNNNNNGDGGEKKNKDDGPITVVLKIDMHCEGCATKIVKTVRGFHGVDAARAELEANKLTAVGKVDPAKLRESLAEKIRKKVDLISPQPKNNDAAKNDKKKPDGNDNKKTPDDNKPKDNNKQVPVTTAVFKLGLHCQGCIAKIHKTVTRTKGYNDISIDKQKDLVTVTGSMDMKALAETLSGKLKKPVEIVPPKKEKDGEKGEKGDGNGGGGKKKGGGGGGGGGDGGQKGDGGDGGGKMEESRLEYMGQPVFGFGYVPGFGYGYPPPPGFGGEHLHAPQMFSDENPNACSIM